MNDAVKNIARIVLFVLIQVYLLNKIPFLHRFIAPYLYFLPLLWLPFSVSRQWLLFIGFLTGLLLDYFMMTPGLHAAACLLIMYVRPFLINILTPKDISEFNYKEPSPKAMQWTPYMVYVVILTLLHHFYMILLEWLSFGTFLDFLIKVVATTGISLLMIFAVELLFPRRLKFRTNTA
ncbi:MAG TPA: rod shape-determining protein MreD [Chitinophagaceae bacterium]|nr:rod shape-determining protein MreD [Chitinophagaceae bacterium]MCB9055388.1 rod shape-determining protein MreD [Chitinophagales bacterium]HRX93182.1 rod shape-determining protein MreD [Chitinophagaceae bacterium]